VALGVGISGMRERVRQLGGRFSIDSSARGTSVRVTLPLGRGH
jgi:signal transduction histidine kinase